ncbi:TPA: hypothetical protein N0F65_000954 [Lagenidium giganteum]|uniref:ABC1 atypical kinase-like domain-containing protein n=1 Tax=Lagenidium giganteum TaxID=4803 RepID=A0AAV2Z085_9STRA|nr:TPA: hypothetical protein N0F65_000954 [Lagenidium giganteum]
MATRRWLHAQHARSVATSASAYTAVRPSRGHRAVRWLTVGGAAGGALYAVDQQNSHVISRSARVVTTGTAVLIDYRRHLKPFDRQHPEYKAQLKAFNLRTAEKLLHLCFQNGGIYTKLGQQLATFNHALPREFTDTLAQLQDQAKPVPFSVIAQAIENELGGSWQQHFQAFDHEPLAAASLAQVHHAVDAQGREVAVKVQYPHLQHQMRTDLVVVNAALAATEYFFPNVQVQWMFPEFQRALKSELDFANEKQNSRRIANYLRRNHAVHVPEVYGELSTGKLLTMEFIRGPKISQVDEIRKLGLDPAAAARVLCDVFGEMIFCHGFVHCDPHAGNLFVRRNPDPKAAVPEQIVLLDHGLYRQLDEDFRRTYCDLWRAMLLRDAPLLEECGRRLNAGPFARFLPLLFTYRFVNAAATGSIDAKMGTDERQQLAAELRKLQFSDITDFLSQLPRDMLFVFRTNNMVRALNKDLGGSTRDRFSSMGKYAAQGHASFYSSSSQHGGLGVRGTLVYWIDHANMLFHLRVIDWALGFVQWARGIPAPETHTVG